MGRFLPGVLIPLTVERGAVVELVFDEDGFVHVPPPNFYPLMHAREMMGQ